MRTPKAIAHDHADDAGREHDHQRTRTLVAVPRPPPRSTASGISTPAQTRSPAEDEIHDLRINPAAIPPISNYSRCQRWPCLVPSQLPSGVPHSEILKVGVSSSRVLSETRLKPGSLCPTPPSATRQSGRARNGAGGGPGGRRRSHWAGRCDRGWRRSRSTPPVPGTGSGSRRLFAVGGGEPFPRPVGSNPAERLSPASSSRFRRSVVASGPAVRQEHHLTRRLRFRSIQSALPIRTRARHRCRNNRSGCAQERSTIEHPDRLAVPSRPGRRN